MFGTKLQSERTKMQISHHRNGNFLWKLQFLPILWPASRDLLQTPGTVQVVVVRHEIIPVYENFQRQATASNAANGLQV